MKRLLVFALVAAVTMLMGASAFAADGDLVVNGNVGVGTTTPGTNLDVNGGIRAGNVGLTCSSSLNGVMRYTGSTYEYCNGTVWKQIGGIFTKSYESSELAFAYNTRQVIQHGLGAVPSIWIVTLRCVASEYNYAVGDEINITSLDHAPSVSLASTRANSTEVDVWIPSTFWMTDKLTGGGVHPTAANWRIAIRAYR